MKALIGNLIQGIFEVQRLRGIWGIFAGCLIADSLNAQAGIDDALVTVGTTTNVSGSDYAYVLWQYTDPTSFDGESVFAVYEKSGPATSISPFQRISITRLQEDPALIAPLIERSQKVGQDVMLFEERIADLFGEIAPSMNLSTAEQLSGVIQGAIVIPELRQTLTFLARSEPAAALALGNAWVAPIAGETTYEIREWDPVAQADIRVIGRVTLDPANPVVLPRSNSVFRIFEDSAQGHLNVKLRWATPDPLRRLSLLSQGYDLYRVEKDLAESEGFHLAAPDPQDLLSVVAANLGAAKVNDSSILIERELDTGEATDTSDMETWFTVDDNDRFDSGGVAFEDGEQFYYFVTAVDVLGQPGEISEGALVTICDKLPPRPPQDIRILNDYDFDGVVGDQRLLVTWKPGEPDLDTELTEYYIYRWESLDQMMELQTLIDSGSGEFLENLIHIEPHVNGLEAYAFRDDDEPDSPSIDWSDPGNGDDAGKTFFYTIRARDGSSCGGNFSFPSSPRYGVLRDRRGPARPTGVFNSECYVPLLTFDNAGSEVDPAPNPAAIRVALVVNHVDSASPAYADFYYGDVNGEPEYVGSASFEEDPSSGFQARFDAEFPAGTLVETVYYAQVFAEDGKSSGLIPSTVEGNLYPDRGVYEWVSTFVSESSEGCQDIWDPIPPSGGPVIGPGGSVNLTVGTREYKIYRRVGDGGPLTMIIQGTTVDGTAQSITWEDPSPPSTPGTVCYFIRLFDVHGNPGPLEELGCKYLINFSMLPIPVLAEIEAGGTESSPTMTVKWFSSPYGAVRFELLIAEASGGYPASLTSEFFGNLDSTGATIAEFPSRKFGVYETQRLSQESPVSLHSYTLPCVVGEEYTFAVRAVGEGGYSQRVLGRKSNIETFVWNSPAPQGPDVRWPGRPRPPNPDTLSGVDAIFLDVDSNTDGTPEVYNAAVRIGEVFVDDDSFEQFPQPVEGFISFPIDTDVDPLYYLFTKPTETGSAGLFPAMLYRYQLATTDFPASGDTTQSTPLMEQIAYDVEFDVSLGTNVVYVRDPYLSMVEYKLTSQKWVQNSNATHGFYLLDSQPVISGATYQYLLVLFDTVSKEIDRVVDCGTIVVP